MLGIGLMAWLLSGCLPAQQLAPERWVGCYTDGQVRLQLAPKNKLRLMHEQSIGGCYGGEGHWIFRGQRLEFGVSFLLKKSSIEAVACDLAADSMQVSVLDADEAGAMVYASIQWKKDSQLVAHWYTGPDATAKGPTVSAQTLQVDYLGYQSTHIMLTDTTTRCWMAQMLPFEMAYAQHRSLWHCNYRPRRPLLLFRYPSEKRQRPLRPCDCQTWK